MGFRRQYGGEGAKCAVLERFDRANGPPCDAGDLFDGKVGDEAKRDDLPLVGCELEQRTVQHWVERLAGGRNRRLQRGQPAHDEALSAAMSMLIHEAVVRDREHPASQIIVTAPKATKAPSNANEHLAEHIFAVLGTCGPQVAMHRSSESGEDIIDRAFHGRLRVRPSSHAHWYSDCCHGSVVVLVLVVDSKVVDVSLSPVLLVVAVGSAATVVDDDASVTVGVVVCGSTEFAGATEGESGVMESSLSVSVPLAFPLPWPAHGGGP